MHKGLTLTLQFFGFLLLTLLTPSLANSKVPIFEQARTGDVVNCVKFEGDKEFKNKMMAPTERRTAFVVGVSAYEKLRPDLRNAASDANKIAVLLQKLGFEIFLLLNGTASEIERCIDEYSKAALKSSLKLVYYSGHGLQKDDENYLLAYDFDASLKTKKGIVPVSKLLSPKGNTPSPLSPTIFLLDACRDLPIKVNLPGLAEMSKASSLPGTFISYATSPNRTADDGKVTQSPFLTALLQHLGVPGSSLAKTMAKVNETVGEATNWSQTPWRRSSLAKNIYLNGNVDIDEIKSISEARASDVEKALYKGDRESAIISAISGLPSSWRDANLPAFSAAFQALNDAFASRVKQLPFNQNTHIRRSLKADRLVFSSFLESGKNKVEINYQLWSLEDLKKIKDLLPSDLVPSLTGGSRINFSTDGKLFSLDIQNEGLRIYRSSDGVEIGRVPISDKIENVKFFDHEILAIKISNDTKALHEVRIYNYVIRKEVSSFEVLKFNKFNIVSREYKNWVGPNTSHVYRKLPEFNISSDGKRLYALVQVSKGSGVSGSNEHYLNVISYDLGTANVVWKSKLLLNAERLYPRHLLLSPDNTILSFILPKFSGVPDAKVYYLDPITGKTLASVSTGKTGDLAGARFTSNSKYLVLVGWGEITTVLDRSAKVVDNLDAGIFFRHADFFSQKTKNIIGWDNSEDNIFYEKKITEEQFLDLNRKYSKKFLKFYNIDR